ncbi:MAG: molecular chaperone [Gammaproteobacteria bacterium]
MKTIAIDYGTSNCAASFVHDGEPCLVQLESGSAFLPSVLWVARSPIRHLTLSNSDIEIIAASLREEQAALRQRRQTEGHLSGISIEPTGLEALDEAGIQMMARNAVRREALLHAEQGGKPQSLSASLIRTSEVLLGTEALRMHMDDPSIGYLIKSPKNFLAVELHPDKVELFVAITAVFLRHLKLSAERALGAEAELIVLGRPVKYHGARAFEPGALDIMRRAAAEAGINDFIFEYEPIAAAVAYEHQLTTDKTVLVLDAGGGTTDCTLMKLGPDRKMKADREADILSTTGERLGGTDLDVSFAKAFFGPALGIGTHFKSGLPVPKRGIMDALSVTDIPAQTRFYGRAMAKELNDYLRDAVDQVPIRRLIELREGHLSMRVNRSAELGKIGLSDKDDTIVPLDYFENPIDISVSRAELEHTIHHYIGKIIHLMQAACSHAKAPPDEIFMTGGTSKIPLMNQIVREQFPGVPIVYGDSFGSVAKGLAIRAETIANG